MIRATMLLIAMGCGVAPAAGSERGELLYRNHCTGCHDSLVHVREDRKAGSPTEIVWQITRWERYLDLGWGYAEVLEVLDYLNSRYYKLPVAAAEPGANAND